MQVAARGVTRALIGEYSYIRVLPDEFLLKSVVFKFISKEISRAEHAPGCCDLLSVLLYFEHKISCSWEFNYLK